MPNGDSDKLEKDFKSHKHTGSDARRVSINDTEGLLPASRVTGSIPVDNQTVTIHVGEAVTDSPPQSLYVDKFGVHYLTDSDVIAKVRTYRGLAAEAKTGVKQTSFAAASAHEHYSGTSVDDHATANTTPATLIAAFANTNTANLDASDNVDYSTTTTDVNKYCYQLLAWDASDGITGTLARLVPAIEASAGGVGQTSGWSAYIWNETANTWDLLGTSGSTYATDETIYPSTAYTDMAKYAASDTVYILIQTTGKEIGGANALNLDVDYAELVTAVECLMNIRGDIAGFSFNANEVGLAAYLDGTPGAITGDINQIFRKRVGTIISTSILAMRDTFTDDGLRTIYMSPHRSGVTGTTHPEDVWGPSGHAGRVAHAYRTAGTANTDVAAVDETGPQLEGFMLVSAEGGVQQFGTACPTANRLINTCAYGDQLYYSNDNGVIAMKTYDDVSTWVYASAGTRGLTFMVDDGDYLWTWEPKYAANGRIVQVNRGTGAVVATSNSILTGCVNEEWLQGIFSYGLHLYVFGWTKAGNIYTLSVVKVLKSDLSVVSTTTVGTWGSDPDLQNPFDIVKGNLIEPEQDGIIHIMWNRHKAVTDASAGFAHSTLLINISQL